MSEKHKINSLSIQISIALLVTGNLIGAGILGIPIIAGICGIVPSTLAMVVFCAAMYYSACVLADETMLSRQETFNYPSLFDRHLGKIGKWIAIVANMLILYGLLTAYLTGGSTIIVRVLDLNAPIWVNTIFCAALTLLTVAGINIIRKSNALMIIVMWISFFLIVFMGLMHVKVENLNHVYWAFFPLIIPVILTSFHFHNIIPNVTHALGWHKQTIYKVMLAGMLVGLAMNLIWLFVGTGVIPLHGESSSLVECYTKNYPATVPMSSIIKSKYFILFSILFSIIAIITSYIASGLGLMSFSKDLLVNYIKVNNKYLVIAVTFLPPFLISTINPNLFLKAINFVGGYGIALLFGILPCIIDLMRKNNTLLRKVVSIFFLILFLCALLFQIGLDFKLLNIRLP